MLTEQEKTIIRALASAAHGFLALPLGPCDDPDEFQRLIYAAQEKVQARAGRRDMDEADGIS